MMQSRIFYIITSLIFQKSTISEYYKCWLSYLVWEMVINFIFQDIYLW